MSMAISSTPYNKLASEGQYETFYNSLTMVQCYKANEASHIFGEKRGNDIPLIAAPYHRGCQPWVIVPEGTWGIGTTQGKFVGVWQPGFLWASCFTRIQYLVTKQHFLFKAQFRKCPTQDDILIDIDISLVIKLQEEHLYQFVYQVGAQQLDEQIKAHLDESVRLLCRKTKHTDAYNMRKDDTYELEIQNKINKFFEGKGVEITQVMIQDVRLPEQIAKNLEDKSTTYATIRLINEEQKLDILKQGHVNDIKMIQQESLMQRQIKEEEFKKQYAEKSKVLKQVEANIQRQLSKIKQQKELEVGQIIVKAEVEATKLKGQADKEASKILAEGQKEAEIIIANAKAEALKIEAQAKASCAKDLTQCAQIEAEAELQTQDQLASKREYDLNLKKINVFKSLGSNKHILISTFDQSTATNTDMSQLYFSQQMANQVTKENQQVIQK